MPRVSIETIEIERSKTSQGFIYALPPKALELLRLRLNASPIRSVSVNFEIKSDSEREYGDVLSHIVPILLGLKEKNDIEKIRQIKLIEAYHRNVIIENLRDQL